MKRRALLAATLATPALAQNWPDRPLRMIVPFPPGGATDVFARRLAARLPGELGQPVVIENRTGAAGAIGTLEAARARPDGQTLLFGTASTLGLYPLLAERPQFDPLRDFLPVAIPGAATVAFVVRPGVADSLPALVAAARARPGALRYGSPGTGSYLHMSFELFKREAGVNIEHVPYRGSAPAMADLLGGHLDALTDTVATTLEQHRAGRARMLAVASTARSPLVPEVPTVAEALGLAGFEAAVWLAVMLPAGTPEPIRARLAAAITATLAVAEFRAELEAAGFEVGGRLSPDQSRDYIAAEQAKWRPIVAATGARLE
ncbi:Bug family tripartite tricarboxylate transporter substrate binding protein [Sediminicoccus rosea]|uniref:Tripartite tricarboxylate transporter substrate binding protein n=1 Tax=Sediminicoccus rosea TaxID=1225128 RepID=A0ABZ0PFC1_9PROT|nr:tripartite tricarboxylate transporter substrate binding protein [Sediminicoccus rosea]WPB84320.1 tripartite tricarboxylate transporter substrate binding protein [Sediminicoccus rosea]